MPTTQQHKNNTGSAFDRNLLWRIYSLAKPYQRTFILAICLTILIALLGPLRPFLIQYTIDHQITEGNIQGIINMSLLIGGLLIIQAMFQLWNTIITNAIGQNVVKDLRIRIFNKLTTRKLTYYDKTPVGTMVTRTTSDIETISDVFSEGLINISGDVLQIVFILIMMLWSDWKMTLVSLSVLPFLLYAGYVFKEKVRISFEDVRNQVSRLNTFVQEHIQGMSIVQLFNREEQELSRFKAINKEHKSANIRSIFYYSVFFPVVEILAAISTGLIVWYGSLAVMEHETSAGIMIAFIMYTNMFFRPIRQIADRFNTLQMGMVAANRIFVIIDEANDSDQSGSNHDIPQQNDIVFDQVSFAYNKDQYVLKDIAFTLASGKTLAIVGQTGSGKTTIINLLSKFYPLRAGEIRLGGISIQDMDNHTLRSKIAVVLQDVFLFSGSIFENISMFRSDISKEQMIETAKRLGAHEFIMNLPGQYNQQVQERGLTLSAGQRQLISFVRAMVTNPDILILDEATSSVDHHTEQVIQQAIDKMMHNRTCIIIAHRLSTIRHANQIMVLHQGKIAEVGTHDSLMLKQGVYYKLCQAQFAESLLYT
jgi:ATP-binding cassette subfamily B multidrug efflux pump